MDSDVNSTTAIFVFWGAVARIAETVCDMAWSRLTAAGIAAAEAAPVVHKAYQIRGGGAEAVTRGWSDLNYDTMVDAVRAYFDEPFYQLVDGFSVENDYFSLHPKIGGTFDHVDGKADKVKNPVDFTFRKRQALRSVIEHITVEIDGPVESGAYIADVQDVVSGATDEKLTSNGAIVV